MESNTMANTANNEEISLDDRNQHDQEVHNSYAHPAPTDHGRQANLVLLGCSLLQLPVWGFPISYGVFQENYASAATDLKGDISSTGIIGTTLNGIIYLSMPVLFGLFTNKYAHYRRHAGAIGIVLLVGSLVLSSFAKEVWQLVLTQGVLQALGSTLLFSSSTIYLDEWFVRRKGFAYGVMLSVKSAVGAGTPLLFGYLISKLGFRNTLRIWSAIALASSAPALFLLRPRFELSRDDRRTRRLSWRFLRHPTFYVFQACNIIFSASYGMPQTYLSTFAGTVLQFSAFNSALILAGLNAPSILASFWFGLLSDGKGIWPRSRPLSISTITFLSAIGACLPVFLFWGPASNQSAGGIVLLAFFAAFYGFFAGGYSAIWGGIVKELGREAEQHNEPVDTALIFGLLNGGRGIGYVAGGFVGIQLLKEGAVSSSHWAYGTKYGSLILFTGIGTALGGASIILQSRRLFQGRS
ncbi:major facilitator superfamily domain-containing protein [Exophiala viscosa]|uniref:Major facilitator superfamily domain-containing protein n=1 Tax=Exophiala viscosa TaxID=2486360 RepID=A0AAN6DWE8_9EURO|nr:major facilitator superfamily domain-containing protein [Exophiala viscosa]